MTVGGQTLEICGLQIEIVRKPIRHLHVRVYPPDGRVRVSAPVWLDEASVRQAVAVRADWIRRQQARLQSQPPPAPKAMVSGETHHVFGRRCILRIVEGRTPHRVILQDGTLTLHVRHGSSRACRIRLLEDWYRRQLAERIPVLIAHWEPRLGVQVAEWRIRRMKTRWGTCNIRARRIWLNLQLATKPPECLEYVVVHEMVHLHERLHNARFYAWMDRCLPDWRDRRRLLNARPNASRACSE